MTHDSKYSAPRSIADIRRGDEFATMITIGQAELDAFSRLTGDTAPVHVDPEHAARLGFSGCIAPGLLVAGMYSKLLGLHMPGPNTVIFKIAAEMVKPVLVGDCLQYRVSVTNVNESVRAVTLALSAQNQAGDVVNRGQAVCIFRGDGA
jgi:3-hydroxybutyryl-CoA dehydratase